jgi:glycosyltransferase involved in cell wall biosynthesis
MDAGMQHRNGRGWMPAAARPARWLAAIPARACARAGRRRIRKAAGTVLSFGGVLRAKRLVHGGAVKLLALRDAFPSNERLFSVLYLVSSAQPPFATDLARHCKNLGIPLLWNQNGVGYPAWCGRQSHTVNAPMRELRSMAAFVIHQSEFCRRSADLFLGPYSRPSTVLLNPVDLEQFHPPTNPLPQRPLRLLAMGTQNYPERVWCVIDTASCLLQGGIECSLTLAGPLLWKNAESQLAKRLQHAKLTNRFSRIPSFNRLEAAKICRSHHILIHPKYLDPCPTVVAEALACGLPVVGSASGGLPEMVGKESGILLPVDESWDHLITPTGTAIAGAVSDLAKRLPSASAAARTRALHLFDQTAWIHAHSRILAQLSTT